MKKVRSATNSLTTICCLLAVVFSSSSAQSFFNTQGLGEIGQPADAYSASLGGIAAFSRHNPAWPVQLSSTSITATLLGTGTVGVEADNSRMVGNVRPYGFYAAVPLPLEGRVLFGLDESFNQDFDVWTESIPNNPYRYQAVSRGGTYALKAGLAWSFPRIGCFGLEYARLLGAAREDWRLVAGGSYLSVDTVESRFDAHSLKAGFVTEIGRFGVGGWFSPPMDLNVLTVRQIHGETPDSVSRQQLQIPWTATVGVDFAASPRLIFSTGVEYRPWSGIAVAGDQPEWRDALRLGGGAEYSFNRLYALRMGYSYQDYHYAAGWAGPEATTTYRPVNEHRLHLGTSLPITGFGSIDFATELARRSNGVLTEYAGRLIVSLAYREVWQRRTRHWGY